MRFAHFIAAALAALLVSNLAHAGETCPENNHQQLYELDVAQQKAEKPDLSAWASTIERYAARCPKDYEGVGYLALQMANIAQRETDGAKSLAYGDKVQTLHRLQAEAHRTNLPPLKFTGADGQVTSSYTYSRVSAAVTGIILPRMAQWAHAGTVHASLAGQTSLKCPYADSSFMAAEDEARFWATSFQKASWLKEEWAKNRVSNLAKACPKLAPYFLLARAKLEDRMLTLAEIRLGKARDEAGNYPTVSEKEQIAALARERLAQAAITAKAYEAFFATKFFENKELEYLQEGFRNSVTDILEYPANRMKTLRELIGNSAT